MNRRVAEEWAGFRVRRPGCTGRRRPTLTVLLAVAALLGPGGIGPAAAQALREELRHRLEVGAEAGVLEVGGERLRTARELAAVYERRGYEPGWVSAQGPGEESGELLAAIQAADSHGLLPQDYHLARITASLSEPDAPRTEAGETARLVDLELILSDAFLVYASHLLVGRVDPETIDPEWIAARRDRDLTAVLENALQRGAVRAALEDLQPDHAAYRALLAALARYRTLAADGGWPTIPEGPMLEPGDRGTRVGALRARLAAADAVGPEAGAGGGVADPAAAALVSDRYDAELEEAVRAFQRRHGLESDARVGPATLAALNVSASTRVRQLEANLERWRWLPESLGDRYAIVNAPDFRLDIVERGATVLSMRAVVGRPYRRTPVFSDRITYLVFSPYWNVPHALAVQDQLPLQRRDPDYFRRVGMRVYRGWGAGAAEVDPASVDWTRVSAASFPYRLRQDPGPQNALGRIKFMFPNRFSVYLHDTPSRDLFSRARRDFSSGCIRVEKAMELAGYLLRDEAAWTAERIREAGERRVEQTVRLRTPLPIHLLYWTAWVAASGEVQFREDIYARDPRLIDALRRPIER